ncbi:MAG: hypothetical protein GYA16_04495 [Spirochaetes bacterium]|nr:hypothetical protein [Spirochaetota bacterium]
MTTTHNLNVLVSMIVVLAVIGIAAAQVGIIRDFDPGSGDYVGIATTEASSYLPPYKDIKYEPFYARDNKLTTAWCEGVKGDGIGEWIQFTLSAWESYGEIINVYRILIVNGFAASKELYYANNRVKKLQIEFSEGQKKILELKDGVLDYQVFVVHTKTKWVRMRILEVYKGKKYDDTCISEVDFESADHPCDLTEEQRARLMKNGDPWDVDPKKWGCDEGKTNKKQKK